MSKDQAQKFLSLRTNKKTSFPCVSRLENYKKMFHNFPDCIRTLLLSVSSTSPQTCQQQNNLNTSASFYIEFGITFIFMNSSKSSIILTVLCYYQRSYQSAESLTENEYPALRKRYSFTQTYLIPSLPVLQTCVLLHHCLPGHKLSKLKTCTFTRITIETLAVCTYMTDVSQIFALFKQTKCFLFSSQNTLVVGVRLNHAVVSSLIVLLHDKRFTELNAY